MYHKEHEGEFTYEYIDNSNHTIRLKNIDAIVDAEDQILITSPRAYENFIETAILENSSFSMEEVKKTYNLQN